MTKKELENKITKLEKKLTKLEKRSEIVFNVLDNAIISLENRYDV